MRENGDQNTQRVFYVDLHTNTEALSHHLLGRTFSRKREKSAKKEKKSGENETKRNAQKARAR